MEAINQCIDLLTVWVSDNGRWYNKFASTLYGETSWADAMKVKEEYTNKGMEVRVIINSTCSNSGRTLSQEEIEKETIYYN